MSRARRAGRIALPIALVIVLSAASIAVAARRPDVRAAIGTAAAGWPGSTHQI